MYICYIDFLISYIFTLQKLKVHIGKHAAVVRNGNTLEDEGRNVPCPTMNTCQTDEYMGIKATRCCCNDKDFCNAASAIPVTFSMLIFSTFFAWFFAYIY